MKFYIGYQYDVIWDLNRARPEPTQRFLPTLKRPVLGSRNRYASDLQILIAACSLRGVRLPFTVRIIPKRYAELELQRPPVHKRLTIAAYAFLAAIVPFPSSQAASSSPQDAAPKENSKSDAPPKKSTDTPAAAKKSTARSKAARKKSEQASAARKAAGREASLEMQPGIVCKSIDGYENYEPLPDAAQTAEEKLLVYFRPSGFQCDKVEKGYTAHLTVDGEIRKRGAKTILRQKKKLIEFNPVYPTPPRFVYVKQSVSLKGLAPGDYDLIIILHDELAKGATATQTVKFKVIPPLDPHKVQEAKEPPPPHILDSLYAPFLDNGLSDDDE